MPRKDSKRKSGKRSQKGGVSAAEYAIGVYGNGYEQHAQAGSNIIEAKTMEGVGCGQKGGDSKKMDKILENQEKILEKQNEIIEKQEEKKVDEMEGGNVLADLAVPVSLVALSQVYNRRKSAKGGKSNKRKGGRRSTQRKRR
jgi:predicted PolB exonuclease-like 3'-5' exonuclease